MKLIHFIPSIDRTSGGVGAYMQLLSKELGKLCDLYIVTENTEHQLKIENADILYIPCNISQYKAMKKEWHKIIDEIKPDLVHVNCCWMPCCALVQKWAQKSGYKVVLTPHGMLEPWIIARHYWTRKFPALLFYQKKAIVNADYLHATAESEKENLLKLGYNNRIQIIPNGVDLENIPMKSSWKRTKTILFLSRIHIKKGINFLIEAVASLKNELNGYRVIIAGEGEENYIHELQKLAKENGISDIIQFVGGVYGDLKWELFQTADVFVLPTHSENFGIVVAEALACGTPVITTKGTPWQELETYHSGWWTEIGTQATIKALRSFLSLTEMELKNMGINGRKLIEEKYSAKSMALKMTELYNRLKGND